ncbi:MAG: hypothetical protein IPJ03_15585 [Ignavibacteriales bacterium]|nr:hypothetical protein [Ignavibacteriales bacterium]
MLKSESDLNNNYLPVIRSIYQLKINNLIPSNSTTGSCTSYLNPISQTNNTVIKEYFVNLIILTTDCCLKTESNQAIIELKRNKQPVRCYVFSSID